MDYFPLFLKSSPHRRIVIVGGGAIALAKLETLLPYAPSLFVVSETFSPTLQSLLNTHHIPHKQARYAALHLKDASLVIAATDDETVNHQIFEDARAQGVLVNVVDNPEFCDFIFPAIIRRGDLQIAVSSSGISPVLARLIKQQIERVIPWNFERLIDFAKSKRKQVKDGIKPIQTRRLFWQEVLESTIAEEVLEGNLAKANKLFTQRFSEDTPQAALYLIGAGPGNPDLMTVKAIRLLSRADVILYDRLVAPQIMEMYARKDAEKIAVGKAAGNHSRKQAEIDALIHNYLIKGKVVVRLKGGDPSIFAHGAEEIAIAKALGVPYQIVPGVTAAVGCAAAAGIPLTERDGALSVRFLTLYQESIADDAFWEPLRHAHKETLVFYMATAQRNLLCEKLIALGFSPDMPMIAIEQGTTPQHREYAGTLATFPALYASHEFASPVLLIIGDVVRFRNEHGWKEPPEVRKAFFLELKKDGMNA